MSDSFDPTALHTGLFIDGAWRAASRGATFPVENPATHEVIAHVADGGPDDAAQAIDAAGRAQAEWAESTLGSGPTSSTAPMNWLWPTQTGSPQS